MRHPSRQGVRHDQEGGGRGNTYLHLPSCSFFLAPADLIVKAIRRARLSIRRAEAAAKSPSVSNAGVGPTAPTAAAAGGDDFDMINGIEDLDEPGDVDDDDDG